MHAPNCLAAAAATALSMLLFPSTVAGLNLPEAIMPARATTAQAVYTSTPEPTPTTTSFVAIPYVHIDGQGSVTTITPKLTTVDRTIVKTISPVPPPLTQTRVQTMPYHYSTVVTTRHRGLPRPWNEKGSGNFLECKNNATDSPTAPWCSPYFDMTLYWGWVYYFIWDEHWFNASQRANTTVRLVTNYINETTGLQGDHLFESDPLPLEQGFYAGKFKGKHRSQPPGFEERIAVNLQLYPNETFADEHPNNATEIIPGPTVTLTDEPRFDNPGPQVHNAELYVALPAVFGIIFVLLLGVCICNRKARRINLGNVMSRSRFNVNGNRSSKRGRRKNGNKYESLQGDDDGGFEFADGSNMLVDDEEGGLGMSSLAAAPPRRNTASSKPFEASSFREELRRQTKKD